jgi:hypothetical protein
MTCEAGGKDMRDCIKSVATKAGIGLAAAGVFGAYCAIAGAVITAVDNAAGMGAAMITLLLFIGASAGAVIGGIECFEKRQQRHGSN